MEPPKVLQEWGHPVLQDKVRKAAQQNWLREKEKQWASRMHKSYNNTIANKLTNVMARRALTYIRPECGFILSVVS